ncbi:hypothetical protein [Nonomuraea sp. NPDC049028]|uniref:hypothetical protein n=1 Tax=Nonomuraea sp. NPDC049028 TaxID=3364348 RepID=UPI0037190FE3
MSWTGRRWMVWLLLVTLTSGIVAGHVLECQDRSGHTSSQLVASGSPGDGARVACAASHGPASMCVAVLTTAIAFLLALALPSERRSDARDGRGWRLVQRGREPPAADLAFLSVLRI